MSHLATQVLGMCVVVSLLLEHCTLVGWGPTTQSPGFCNDLSVIFIYLESLGAYWGSLNRVRSKGYCRSVGTEAS